MASNMHDIKNRINSVSQTLQITKAMKLISGVKLKKARAQLEETIPYFDRIRLALADILENSVDLNRPCLVNRALLPGFVGKSKKAVIVLSGDKGLVGGYNNAIMKLIEEVLVLDENVTLFIAGNVGRQYFKKFPNVNVVEDFYYNVSNPTIYRAADIANMIHAEYLAEKYDEVYILYTHMISAMHQEQRVIKLLPIDKSALTTAGQCEMAKLFSQQEDSTKIVNSSIEDAKYYKETNDMNRKEFIYEPGPEQVFTHLIPQYLKGIIYGTLVEAYTCEQSARMTAMENATSNAEEIINKQHLYYNQARQAQITQELSEIIGGATALE